MDVEQMRGRILDQYPSPGWKMKVKKMSDAQVIAIYKRLNSQ